MITCTTICEDTEPCALRPEDAPAPAVPFIDTTRPLHESQALWVSYFEREYLRRLLESQNFDLDRAARVADMSRVDFDALLATLGVVTAADDRP